MPSEPGGRLRWGPAELVRAAAIARRFFVDGRSKTEIADEFGLSRFKIARVLSEARSTGLVRIAIALPAGIDAELSEALRVAYGLRNAIVVIPPDLAAELDGAVPLRALLGRVAAGLLAEVVPPGTAVGVGGGRTVEATVAALTRMPPCTAVQLTGAATGIAVGPGADGPVDAVRRVARLAGGRAYPIPAPLIAPDPGTAAALRERRQVAAALARHDHLAAAVVGVGSWEPPDSQLRDALSEVDRVRLRGRGVRAEVCGALLDGAGREVDTDLRRRTVAVTGEQLRRVPEVIAVAGGATKAAATRAVLRGGYASSIVTDAVVARYLLADPPTEQIRRPERQP